jgi:uncharacterized protein
MLMAIDRRLLEILCCPVCKRSLQPMRADQLQCLNAAISAGNILDVEGRRVANSLQAGLITDDGRVIYRVEDDIPVLLPEEGIGTTQIQDFPA